MTAENAVLSVVLGHAVGDALADRQGIEALCRRAVAKWQPLI